MRFVWRSLHEPGVVHDERAYLLQAEIFSRGHWAATSPPLAAFFEQMHVFIEPAVFAKYPPGHALTLVPGIWLGLPGLMPVVLAGFSGMLIFWLARRSNEWTALLTWWLWTTAWVTLIGPPRTSRKHEHGDVAGGVVGNASLAGHEPCGVSRLCRCRARVGHHGAAVDDGRCSPCRLIRHCPPHRGHKGGGEGSSDRPGPERVSRSVRCGTNRRLVIGWRSVSGLLTRLLPVRQARLWRGDPTPPLRALPRQLRRYGEWSKEVHQPYVPAAVPSALTQRILAGRSRSATAGGSHLCSCCSPRAYGPPAPSASPSSSAHVSLRPIWCSHSRRSGVVTTLSRSQSLHFMAAVALVRLLRAGERPPEARVASYLPMNLGWASTIAVIVLLPLCLGDLVRVLYGSIAGMPFIDRLISLVRSAPPQSMLFVRYPPTQSPHFAITRNQPDLAHAAIVGRPRSRRRERPTGGPRTRSQSLRAGHGGVASRATAHAFRLLDRGPRAG